MVPRSELVPIPGSYRAAVSEAKRIGKANPKERIQVSIYARQNPRSLGTSEALNQAGLEAPNDRRYLSKEEFAATYGADPEDVEKIVAWAKEKNLKVIDSSAAKRRILVEGTVADIESAFGVELNEYDHPESGRYRGREGEIHVPAALSGVVEGVFGLDTRRVGRPRNCRSRALPTPWRELQNLKRGHEAKKQKRTLATPSAPWAGTFFPPRVASLYNYPKDADGTGQNIGIFAFNGGSIPDPHGGYNAAALDTYFKDVLGGQTPAITDVVVHGAGNDPGADTSASAQQGDATGEVMLDMCIVGSVAPGAHIFMYFTEFTTQGWIDAIQEAIAGDNDLSVISISYGNPEDDPRGAWTKMGAKLVSQAFEAAAARGITICCASGDDGSKDQVATGAHVDFPASSPFVLGVGGTKLVASSDDDNATIAEETVWNEDLIGEGAGGGGISVVFSKPTYQNSVNVPASVSPHHPIGRGVPDVAAVADPETGVVRMNVDGVHIEPTGGTSASAPLWASLIARLNQKLNARCGFLNPVLYEKCANGVLHDITDGNNGAYSANAGWDACTGLGTPDGDKLFQALTAAAGPQRIRTSAAAASGKEGAA